VRGRAHTTLTTLLLVSVANAGDRTPTLAQLAGRYFSSENGGCTLLLKARAEFDLTCRSGPTERGEVLVSTGPLALVILLPFHDTAARVGPQVATHQGPPRGAWPPRLRDPTPPLTRQPRLTDDHMVLHVVEWGSRVYLVRLGARGDFCDAVATGLEPRAVAEGAAFLRVGDHAKPAGDGHPKLCDTRT
jgi:hypothetical protein